MSDNSTLNGFDKIVQRGLGSWTRRFPRCPETKVNGTGRVSKIFDRRDRSVRWISPLRSERSSWEGSRFYMKSPSTLLSTLVISFSNIILKKINYNILNMST